MERVYISGKITGLTVEEFTKNFEVVCDYVVNVLKAKPFSPIDICPYDPNKTWADYMAVDIKFLDEECDSILMLPNWKDSAGARIELQTAIERGKTIYFMSEWK